MNESGTDFIVSELLSELKEENSRKDSQIKNLSKTIKCTVALAVAAILIVVAAFLIYLNQYDFSSSDTTTNNAEGVYAIIDSEGKVVGTDLTAEDMQCLLEGVNDGTSEFD